jgi:hypothetical protein
MDAEGKQVSDWVKATLATDFKTHREAYNAIIHYEVTGSRTIAGYLLRFGELKPISDKWDMGSWIVTELGEKWRIEVNVFTTSN